MAARTGPSIPLIQVFLPPCARGDDRERSTVEADQCDFFGHLRL